MIKLLAADDEYWVREKLRQIIDWQQYDIEFLEPACDGEEVLSRIETESPDILITDINMPGLNGVELLEHLSQKHPELVLLVISGYDTFDFVRRSMRSGAINYLLKPVTRADMAAAISEALQILRDRDVTNEEQKRQREQLLRSSSLLKDQELSMLLDQPEGRSASPLPVDLPQENAEYCLVLMKIHDMTRAMEEYRYDIANLSYETKAAIRSVPGTENALVFNYLSRSSEFILLTEQPQNRLAEAAEQYKEKLEKLFHCPVTVVLGQQKQRLNNIQTGYLWAQSQLARRRFAPCSEIICFESPNQPDDGQLRWTEELNKQLEMYLTNGNREQLSRTLIQKTGLSTAGTLKVSCGAVRRLVSRMNHSLQSTLLRTGSAEDASVLTNLAEEVIRSVDSLVSDTLIAREFELIDTVAAGCINEETDSMKAIVRRVQEDIDAHYYEPLTLTFLAEKYIVEQSYLSRSFKQEVGENLILYLAKRRIAKAIELMKEDKVGLTEISFLVGYDDYTYFSRVFKKISGFSPREYKARYLTENGGDGA